MLCIQKHHSKNKSLTIQSMSLITTVIFALISTDYQIDFIISTLLNQRNHNFHSAAIKLGNKRIKPLQNGFISLYEDLCMEMSLTLY